MFDEGKRSNRLDHAKDEIGECGGWSLSTRKREEVPFYNFGEAGGDVESEDGVAECFC